MTRKHFQAIAEAVKRSSDRISFLDLEPSRMRLIMSIMADEMADSLANDNPRFDRERFLKACGF